MLERKRKREHVLEELGIALSTLKKWLKRFDEGGEKALREQTRGRPVSSGTKLSVRQFKSLKIWLKQKT